MDREAERRASQLAFDASSEDIVIGDAAALPLSVEQLQTLGADSEPVAEIFEGGLTASVYHLNIDGEHWNLKRKRDNCLVQNADGQTSFLNEVQRRQDLMALKHSTNNADNFQYVVNTCYASYRQGIMLSPWISGEPIKRFDERNLQQLYQTLIQFELNGMLDWDPSPGNILDDGKTITLFDFGYCYRFDPLTEFNSNGTQLPLFHAVERVETRSLSGHLLKLELQEREQEAASLFEMSKRIAIENYRYKLSELKRRGASLEVRAWLESIIGRWQQALTSRAALEDLYLVEMYRSHRLDVIDDVMGKSCTPTTLKRINKLEVTLTEHADTLAKLDGLNLFGENKSSQTLLKELTIYRHKANKYQL